MSATEAGDGFIYDQNQKAYVQGSRDGRAGC